MIKWQIVDHPLKKDIAHRLIPIIFAVLAFMMLLSCGSETAPPETFTERKLVLLVHGYQGEPANLRFYRDRLREALPSDEWQIEEVSGLDSSYNISSLSGPDGNTGVIERFIEGITGKKVGELETKSLFFVAHSMGGLISRQFSVWHRDQTAKIFMLGTPNGGMNSLSANSWAASERMNNDDGNVLSPWTAWNKRHRAQADVEHYLFIGVCTNPAVSIIEGSPNDGLVGSWSVAKLEAFTDAGAILRKRELHDGHGVIPNPGCFTTLIADEAISTAIIGNLKQGIW